MNMSTPPGLRNLPSVDSLVADLASSATGHHLPRALVVEIARSSIESARVSIVDGGDADPAQLAAQAVTKLQRLRHQRVINGTGVLLHTNLGRAPLHPEAAAAAVEAAEGYSNIEFDLNEGRRGSRGAYLVELLKDLTGAESALVVNNNAAALYLTLHTLAAGASVPVSRGELIEIGGSYRLPDLMAASSAELVEVGTTNRTRIADYKMGLRPDTQMLLKVHPSNYRVTGFSEGTSVPELVELGSNQAIPFVFDIGSGLLDSSVSWLPGGAPGWLADEPSVVDSLQAGVDVVTLSGDKLFGGPQAGIIVGGAEIISRLKSSPVARALRVDGATIAALTATAELYANNRGHEIPFWRMVSATVSGLRDRLEAIANAANLPSALRESEAMAGAGSVPGMTVPSPVLVIKGRGEDVWQRLLETDPIVVARRDAGDLLLDARAIDPADDERVAESLRVACQ